MTPLRGALALIASLAFITSCSSTAAPAPAAGGASAGIDISGFVFKTAALDVTKGTTVTWSNQDGTTHHVMSGTSPTSDGKFDGTVAAGGTFSFTFNNAGTFPYFCSIHPSMTGTITVK
jgi:plastocyanin